MFLSTASWCSRRGRRRIKEIIDVDLPPPRTLAMKLQPQFLELEQRVWRLIEEEAEKTGMLTVA